MLVYLWNSKHRLMVPAQVAAFIDQPFYSMSNKRRFRMHTLLGRILHAIRKHHTAKETR